MLHISVSHISGLSLVKETEGTCASTSVCTLPICCSSRCVHTHNSIRTHAHRQRRVCVARERAPVSPPSCSKRCISVCMSACVIVRALLLRFVVHAVAPLRRLLEPGSAVTWPPLRNTRGSGSCGGKRSHLTLSGLS